MIFGENKLKINHCTPVRKSKIPRALTKKAQFQLEALTDSEPITTLLIY